MSQEQTASSSSAPGRLVLLSTTHRVAPGLLSGPAWQTLHTADRILAGDPAHPLLAPLERSGVGVEVLDVPSYARARTLAEAAADTVVVWLVGPDGDPGLTDALARFAVEGAETPGVVVPELELLPGSYDLPGARLLDLVAVMDRLRSPGGCPWDAEQTHESLVKYLVEESFELVEAIEENDRAMLREELGDVLLQVFFHSRIAQEHPTDPFSIDEVAGDIVDKLIYRHPHVFADRDADTAEQVEANWEELKAAEKQRESATDGVPMGQPALALAAKLHARAGKAGVRVEPAAAGESDFGARLLRLAVEAQDAGVDPEAALREAARAYRDAIRAAEGVGTTDGVVAVDGGATAETDDAGRTERDG
ncbi:MazG family protein [Streptacidiphilus jiangxiensis]|uniref:XTP/dITP diphosphohydrolase n=1 Tax=Streptacidiphilus jiangxiensis TaxID=235985 RepID=A0A1H7FFN1_STRJI|nr:MazG family protein [Streptacidiphilus jiangxiensis]SEK24886.1 XTP/dITP diphosphohydrolase [Streptacidiphilus jiangxiensis]